MQDENPQPLDYEPANKRRQAGPFSERLIFTLGCMCLSLGLGVSIDPHTTGPGAGIMALGGFLIGLVYPLRGRSDDH